MSFSSDGVHLAAYTKGHNRYDIWEIETSRCIGSLTEIHGTPLNDCWQYATFVPGRRALFISSMDQSRVLWDYDSNDVTMPITGEAGRSIAHTAFSSDGRLMVTGGQDHTVRLWDTSETPYQEIKRCLGHQGEVWAVAMSPDRRHIVSGGVDFDILSWDIERQEDSEASRRPLSWSKPLFFNNDKLIALATGVFPDNKVSLYDIDQESYLDTDADGWPLMFAEDEEEIIVGKANAEMEFLLMAWGLPKLQWAWQMNLESSAITLLGCDKCERRGLMAFSYNSGAVWLVDIHSRRKHRFLEGDGQGAVWAIALSPNGDRILTGRNGDVANPEPLTMWSCKDLDMAEPLYQIKLQHTGLWSADFSPDGRLVATGFRYGRIVLWGAATGDLRHELLTHKQRVNDLAFSPDGRTLASASDDESVKLWHVATGRELLTFCVASDGIGHSQIVC